MTMIWLEYKNSNGVFCRRVFRTRGHNQHFSKRSTEVLPVTRGLGWILLANGPGKNQGYLKFTKDTVDYAECIKAYLDFVGGTFIQSWVEG